MLFSIDNLNHSFGSCVPPTLAIFMLFKPPFNVGGYTGIKTPVLTLYKINKIHNYGLLKASSLL